MSERRYLPPSRVDGNLLHVDKHTRWSDFIARSSSDPVLTAFAQLGALRLDAQRVNISLFGRHEQHILTESTRTLSLQDDAEHNTRDRLWLGNCTVSYDRSLCNPLFHATGTSEAPNRQLWIVPDLTKDAELKDHPDVTSYPNVRFLASSPIFSPSGMVIGAYIVLDDKPRELLDPSDEKFLSDMATTVMDYLEAMRSKDQHLRAERMIVGIGSFLEGKGSLRNSWLDATGKLDDANDEDAEQPEGTINEMQQKKQIADNVSKAIGESDAMSGTFPIRSREERARKRTNKAANTPDRVPLKPLPEKSIPASMGQRKSPFLQKGLQPQLEEAFSRGANIIRESIEVEGAVFFDANFGTRGAFVASEKSDNESSGRDSYSSASGDDEGRIRGAFSATGAQKTTANAADSGKDAEKPCRILGFATSNKASVNEEMTGDRRIAISEPFLASLLRRYPQGKIFNFFEDGSISSSETSDSTFKNFYQGSSEQNDTQSGSRRPERRRKRTRKAILRQDAESLLQLAPDSRSIIFTPLWDSHKGRWYSAGIAWTRSPHRVFTSDDELSFMFAFGNSMMAEVHRLVALYSEQAKSTLLAGLSHELRSPLHGIFGMADLLNTSVMNTLQRGFVHTISSCAFTLLGSINQLLEYARIKDIRAQSAYKHIGGASKDQTLTRGKNLRSQEDDESTHVYLAAVTEDAVETVFAGYSFFNGLQFPIEAVRDGSDLGADRFDTPGGVQVILDIASISDQMFLTRPGAWHAILTNIVGNSLKFTQHGYVHVSIDVSPVATLENEGVVSSKIILTVKDSGCGINPEFLRDGLFAAFSQEDNMATGNGLGLNITQRIVNSLGGTIHVDSRPGGGTEVRVSVELENISDISPLSMQDISTNFSLAPTKDLVRDKRIGLIGHWSSDSKLALCSSLQQLCKECFQMDVHLISASQQNQTRYDFYILPFESLNDQNMDIESFVPQIGGRFLPAVIVICPSPRIAHAAFVESQKQPMAGIVEFISQPCGPRKLAKAFQVCLSQQKQGVSSPSAQFEAPSISTTLRPMELNRARTDPESSTYVVIPEPSGQLNIEKIEIKDRQSSSVHSEGQGTIDSQATAIPVSKIDLTVPSPDQVNEPCQPQQDLMTTVLIVDDNIINVKILVEFMKKLGCKHATASNGLEALEFFKENATSIALIIMGKLQTSFPIVFLLLI